MKKASFKLISLVVCLAMLFTLLVGCGTTTTPSAGSTTAEVQSPASTVATQTPEVNTMSATLKFVFPGDKPKAQDQVNQAVSEKCKKDGLDFTFEYTFVPWDQYFNKLSLIVAGGEDQDLTWTHISMLPGQIGKKIWAPLDDALKTYGPEIMKVTPSYQFKEVSVGGKIYAMPRLTPNADGDHLISIREDLRKKYNCPEVKTLDDLNTFLAAVKTNDPTMTPCLIQGLNMTVRSEGDIYFPIVAVTSYPFYIDIKDTSLTVKSFYESEIFAKQAALHRDWYLKGYLPKDYTSANKTQDNDWAAGKVGVIYGSPMLPTERLPGLVKSVPTAEMIEVALNPERPKVIWTSVDNMLSVFATSKKVNEAVAFVNWFKTNQENYDLFTFGVKDVNYKMDGNGITTEGIADTSMYNCINWSWTDLRFHRFDKSVPQTTIDTIKNWDNGAIQSPLLGFIFNAEPVKAEIAKINAVEAEYAVPILYGVTDFSKIKDKFIAKFKAAGSDKVIAELQTQINAFKVANP